jgi:hypothetical protein
LNAHCKAAKDHIDVAESGDSKTAAYRRAAEEIEKAINEDDLTQRQVAEQIGKSQKYVDRLLRALRVARDSQSPFAVDWQSGSVTPRIPTPSAKRAELATELMSDPVIAKAVADTRTSAASNMRKIVHAEDKERFAKAVEYGRRKRQVEAMPIPSLFTKIAETIGDWSNALMDIEEDLVEARDQFGGSIVITALRMHAATCSRLADRMELDQPAVIESNK